ncbi:MAG: sugar transferase [Solirubrobacterales bacterium]
MNPVGTDQQRQGSPEAEVEGPPPAGSRFGAPSGDADALGSDRRGYTLRRVLALSDLAALLGAYVLMLAVQEIVVRPGLSSGDFVVFLVLLPGWFLLAHLLGLYHQSGRRIDHSIVDDIGPIFVVTTVWSWFFLYALAAVRSGANELLPIGELWLFAILLPIGFRAIVHWFATSRPWFQQRTLVVGAPGDVERVITRIQRHPECGLDIVKVARVDHGVVRLDEADNGAPSPPGGDESPRYSLSDVIELAGEAKVDRVVVTAWPDLTGRTELLRTLVEAGVHVDLVSGEPEALTSSGVLHHLEGLPMLAISPVRITQVSQWVKRALDIFLAAGALILLSPLLAYIAVRIKLDSPGPVLFRQRRAGRGSSWFDVLKFRTMVVDADDRKGDVAEMNMHGNGRDAMFKVHDDPRVTRFGAWLRRWSLDELPQLWNVLKGEMSMVGPRPLIPEEARMIDGHYLARLAMRPGITGAWQTQGRSDIPFEEMLKLDYTYAMTWTLREDVRLMLRTVSAVARARGAY